MKYFYSLLIILVPILLTGCGSENGIEKQDTTKEEKLKMLAKKFKQEHDAEKKEAIEFAKQHQIPLRKELPDGSIVELQKIENGTPMYYHTDQNENIQPKKSTQQGIAQ